MRVSVSTREAEGRKRRSTVFEIQTKTVTGTLRDLFTIPDYTSQGRDESSIEMAFRGRCLGKPPFRLVAADEPNHAVFFSNRELLARFCALPTPSQKDFLQRVRAVMRREGVNSLFLQVDWSGDRRRTIEIKAEHNPDYALDIDLV